MKKSTKAWLIAAACLVLAGGVLFAGVMSALGWDFAKLSTAKYETNVHEIGEEFDSISIRTDTAGVVFAPSDDGSCRVECYEDKDAKHSVAVENNTLVVGANPRPWYKYIGLSFDSSKITVYLPKADYASLSVEGDTGDVEVPQAFAFRTAALSLSTGSVHFCGSASEVLKIKTSTGAIRVENGSAGALDLKVTTGKVTVSGVTCGGDVTVGVSTGRAELSGLRCRSVISSGSTGSISLENVIAEEKFSLKRSTGKIKFLGSDAAEIFAETDTGSVTGTLLTGKAFVVRTGTGRVDVPESTEGGRCEIVTGTGDIKITIDGR